MEAATKTKKASGVQAGGSELSIKLGAFMLACLGGRGSQVIRVIDESGLTFAQMKVLVELETPSERGTVTALAEELGVLGRVGQPRRRRPGPQEARDPGRGPG